MLFANIVFKPSILFSNSEPVGINPSAVGFAGWFDGHKSYFGTNPLALFHGIALSGILVFLAVGAVGDSATITAHIRGNENVSTSITVTIADIEKQSANIVISPLFEKIRQNDNISFNIVVEYAGETRTDLEDVVVSIADADREFVAIDKIDDLKYLMVCKKIARQPIEMTVSAKIAGTDISADKVFAVKTVGMFG